MCPTQNSLTQKARYFTFLTLRSITLRLTLVAFTVILSSFSNPFLLRKVVGYWITQGKSFNELAPHLEGVANRVKQLGFEGPLLYYTDNCCAEASIIRQIFFTLKSNNIPIQCTYIYGVLRGGRAYDIIYL